MTTYYCVYRKLTNDDRCQGSIVHPTSLFHGGNSYYHLPVYICHSRTRLEIEAVFERLIERFPPDFLVCELTPDSEEGASPGLTTIAGLQASLRIGTWNNVCL